MTHKEYLQEIEKYEITPPQNAEEEKKFLDLIIQIANEDSKIISFGAKAVLLNRLTFQVERQYIKVYKTQDGDSHRVTISVNDKNISLLEEDNKTPLNEDFNGPFSSP